MARQASRWAGRQVGRQASKWAGRLAGCEGRNQVGWEERRVQRRGAGGTSKQVRGQTSRSSKQEEASKQLSKQARRQATR